MGNRVSVAVPKLDRTATDLPQIPCVASQVHGKKVKTYSLGMAYGTLATNHSLSQDYTGDVPMEANVTSLREST